jgi:uncharacterized membrane protein
MSSTQTAPVSATSRLFGPRLLIQLALGCLIPLGIIAAAVGPRRAALGLTHLPPVHPHAPQLWRLLEASPGIQIHLAAVILALGVGAVLLTGVKGTTLHRTLGWGWVIAMMTAAVSSLFIRIINHGQFSFIHLLSGWTILILPVAVMLARRHKARAHGRAMTGIFTGGLILAGLLAFMPGRLMWQMILG